MTSKLALDVFVPASQPNPSFVGSVQAFFSSPSAGLNNVYLGQASLTNAFFDRYNSVSFDLPANVVATLGGNRPDCQLSFALNVGTNGARYFFDSLGFVAPP